MPAQPSYYDSIGLLAICDAIDSVDGIPFYPKEPPKMLPEVHRSTTVVPAFPAVQARGKTLPPQHTFLSHIPVTGVLSPVGSIPYEEEQRVAISQLSTAGQLPPLPPQHTIGGVRPNIPVAHNLHGKSGSRSSADLAHGIVDQDPTFRSLGSIPSHSNSPSISGVSGAPPGIASGMSPRVSVASGSVSVSPRLPPPLPLHADVRPDAVPMRQFSPDAASPESIGSPSLVRTSYPSVNSASPAPLVEHSVLGSEFSVESCQICGREFKGAKASTHKQQHIRRLHPTEYIPKRGGKRPRGDYSV